MQRAAIVGGTLGLGTALVFGAAALASTLFPNGATVPMGWDRGVIFDKRIGVPVPAPAIEPGVIDDGSDIIVLPDEAPPAP